MSFGAGHVQDMNNRMKQHRSQRTSNKPKFKGNERELISQVSKLKPEFKKVSEEKLNLIKKEIRDSNSRENLKTILVYLLVLICVFATMYFFIFASPFPDFRY